MGLVSNLDSEDAVTTVRQWVKSRFVILEAQCKSGEDNDDGAACTTHPRLDL